MKKVIVLLAVLAACSFVVSQAQDSTRSTYFPQMPKPGENMKIVYHASKKTLAGNKISGIIYLFDTTYHWRANDLTLQQTGDSITATYLLPADAALAAWKFNVDGKEDRGSKFPYAVMMSAPAGGLMPGAYYAWGTMRAPYFQRMSPPVSDTASYIAPEVVRMWIRNEMVHYPGKRLSSIGASFTVYRMVDTSAAATATMHSELKRVTVTPGLTEKTGWMYLPFTATC